MVTAPAELSNALGSAEREVARRRTFAIISHPDAGKTTLTEKLLLYGGAIHLAGTVKARRASRHVTSDWMAMERERGISVTSSVMQFDHAGRRLNLLDTPGHQDFSEDTYRTLVAADSAVMLLDSRKGVEERTRQLFAVCAKRRLPIFTVVNKCDRPGGDALRLLSDVEAELGITCCPMNWPVYRPDGFAGTYDLGTRTVRLFKRQGDHGATQVGERQLSLADPALVEALGAHALARLVEEIELVEGAGVPFDRDLFLAGTQTPVYFASALTNFGVGEFLESFLDLAPDPDTARGAAGSDVATRPFSGFVFKIQANMDARHRDRVAFLRVVAGRYRAGETTFHPRTGRTVRLSAPQQFLARDRTAVEEAWAGDVVGLMDRGLFRIGDTLTAEPDVEYAGIPRFAPEHFAQLRPADPLRRKQFDTGLRELSEEGAAQVFHRPDEAASAPVVGTVGVLQFDVLKARLEQEYGAPCSIEPVPWGHPRWVSGPEAAIYRAGNARGRQLVRDANGAPVLLFEDAWALRSALGNEPALTFAEESP